MHYICYFIQKNIHVTHFTNKNNLIIVIMMLGGGKVVKNK